jgi:hypothetical protein
MSNYTQSESIAVEDGNLLYCYSCARKEFGSSNIQAMKDDIDFAPNGKGGLLRGKMRKDVGMFATCSRCKGLLHVLASQEREQAASPPFHPQEVERLLPEGMRLVTLHESEESAHHGVLRVAASGIAALLFHLPSQFDPFSWAVTVSSEVDRRALLRSLYPTWNPLRNERP